MDERIVEFTALLRANGLRVSMAEHLDAFAALRRLGIADRIRLKDTLRATMVKRSIDVQTFDELFDLYFSALGDAVQEGAASTMRNLELSEADLQKLLEQLGELLSGLDGDLSELAQALLQNDTGRLEQMLRQGLQQADAQSIERVYQEGRYAHAVGEAMAMGALGEELDRLREQLGEMGLAPELRELLEKLLDQRMKDLREMIRRAVRMELEKRDHTQRERDRMATLAEKSFYYLSEDEIRRMKEAVARLAERLKNVVAVRRKRGKRGKFDVKATFRKNLQYGGVPFRIHFDRRVRERPQVVVLCDVSDSVRNVSRFMLQFVYSLQDLYSRVRSFIFVSDIGEITQLFEENDIQEAISQALTGNVINVYAHSDFGTAFRQFHRDFLTAINNRTTVIILGDARNNYNLAHEWVLRDVQQRAKQVIWLNPESRLTWGFGDSEMDRYQPFCDMVEECRNLNQLYRVVDHLVA
jgi:uncharacterized protein with von Willebrand factor type A (vWA) domain